MNTETFEDGSTIDTDPVTGNRTVFGAMAHKEYFRRLSEERIMANTSPAIVAFCKNLDGSRKAELIRKVWTNPITIEHFGKYSWGVWSEKDPKNVTLCRDEESARAMFKDTCVFGTNSSHIDGR